MACGEVQRVSERDWHQPFRHEHTFHMAGAVAVIQFSLSIAGHEAVHATIRILGQFIVDTQLMYHDYVEDFYAPFAK